MTVRGFVGGAGTGKTTALMAAVGQHLAAHALTDGERVLALTRMHGARHRLDAKLGTGPARGRYDCMTLDRLAWMVTTRWRSRLSNAQLGELDFDGVCAAAADLLEDPVIARWVTAAYPLVIVDEFQDCRDSRLRIVQAIATCGEVLLAADEFQDLSAGPGAPATDWLRTAGEVVELTNVHRTKVPDLLMAATALRQGGSLNPGAGRGFCLWRAPSHNVAAKFIAMSIKFAGDSDVVLLSPTTPSRSPFVRSALARLAEGPFADKKDTSKSYGPYTVLWESSVEEAHQALVNALKLPAGDSEGEPVLPSTYLPGLSEFRAWLDAQRRRSGRTSFSGSELEEAAKWSVHHHRAHAPPSRRRLRAMTIQQAKNQEFAVAVVLWPYETAGDEEKLRRLLYNAITRASKRAVVIVQDPREKRLAGPPFTSAARTEAGGEQSDRESPGVR